MAKVDFPDYLNPALYTQLKPDTKKTKEGAKTGKTRRFAAILDEKLLEEPGEAPQETGEMDLQRLLDGVHSAGDTLKARPYPAEIKRYKQAVRDFIRYIVDNTFDTEEQQSGGLFKRKKWTLVTVVDRKLEQLAAGILSGQHSQMEILFRVDEIAGILVDILQ
jgi:uncharacterized protein YaaR (DUF327 family)